MTTLHKVNFLYPTKALEYLPKTDSKTQTPIEVLGPSNWRYNPFHELSRNKASWIFRIALLAIGMSKRRRLFSLSPEKGINL